MKKQTKSGTQLFADKAGSFLRRLGAVRMDDDLYMNQAVYLLETKLGYLTFKIPMESQNVWTIWGRFDIGQRTQPELLKDFGANKHSGKWNIHLSDALRADEAVEALEIRLDELKSIL